MTSEELLRSHNYDPKTPQKNIIKIWDPPGFETWFNPCGMQTRETQTVPLMAQTMGPCTGCPLKPQLKSLLPNPLECAEYPKRPYLLGSLHVLKTIAPAPSPNNMQLFQSLQSTHLLMASAPTTNAFVTPLPSLSKNCPAVTTPNRNPLQAGVKSHAKAFEQPRFAATEVASPNKSSGELVAQMTMSISSGEIPLISKAFLAALADRVLRLEHSKSVEVQVGESGWVRTLR